MQVYEYCLTLHDFLAKAISWEGYLHLCSILLNCANADFCFGLHLCIVPLIIKNVNWYNLSEFGVKYSIICFPDKLFTFVQLLQECEYFLDIKLFYLQIILIWWKMVISIFMIQILHFLINIAGFIHICAVRRFTAQIEIYNQQIIFIISM